MHTLIKWPGGKTGEIKQIERLIPPYKRYVEPFFGGGALFFHLQPPHAAINDISQALMQYYGFLKSQDRQFYDLLLCYSNSFAKLLALGGQNYKQIYALYDLAAQGKLDREGLIAKLSPMTELFLDQMGEDFAAKLLLNKTYFTAQLDKMAADKIIRTVKNHIKQPFSDEDLKNNLLTGLTSGYYMYFRMVFNDINLHRLKAPSRQYESANFYFIREYCYGSMFRYNNTGEFNIPYGGMSYNKKSFKCKIDKMFSADVKEVFKNTKLYCCDFAEFFKKIKLTKDDFMFLDPPYDTDFSDYEGRAFDGGDQRRLAHELKKTPAQFILVIKNTEFIYSLYKDDFNILAFDNQYTYNVRSRNKRDVEHLIITNLPVD